MKKYLILFSILISILSIYYPSQPIYADLLSTNKKTVFLSNIDKAAAEEYIPGRDLNFILSRIISLVLSLIGVIFIILTFLAGNDWMHASGNEEKVEKAKETLKNLLIGLALVLLSYVVSSEFAGNVLKSLVK